ncbi:MAG: SOS response-associated peptidase [Planctomycetota bacterium]
MCGRFTLRTPAGVLMQIFHTPAFPELHPRWNIAPTQQIVAVTAAGTDAGRLQAGWFRWGLVPFWADDPSIGSRLLNARSETAAEKPAFRAAFRKRRCLIPADGFYEWQTLASKKKQPWWIHQPDQRPFAMAGLWEVWTPGGKQAAAIPSNDAPAPLLSCTVLTTTASSDLCGLHDRMPVILPPALWPLWLNPQTPSDTLRQLLQPASPGTLLLTCVSTRVNRPTPDSPDCITPVSPPEPLPGFGPLHM